LRHRGLVPVFALIALIACHDERPSKHVYGSPPSQSPRVAATPAPPELPIGTIGPGAQLVSVSDAATGAPVGLSNIADSVDVLTLVAFGPHSVSPRNEGRVELAVHGASLDTTLVLRLESPAPSLVAHTFRVAGLKSGRYTSVVLLRASTGRVIAESIPLYLEVVRR
jgi:hypothetical protein